MTPWSLVIDPVVVHYDICIKSIFRVSIWNKIFWQLFYLSAVDRQLPLLFPFAITKKEYVRIFVIIRKLLRIIHEVVLLFSFDFMHPPVNIYFSSCWINTRAFCVLDFNFEYLVMVKQHNIISISIK